MFRGSRHAASTVGESEPAELSGTPSQSTRLTASVSRTLNRTFGEYNYRSIPLKSIVEEGVGTEQLAQVAADVGTDLPGYLQDLPGLSAFAFEDGVVHHTYSTYARGAEFLLGYYALLDRAPKGRNEGSPPEAWIRRKDEYDLPLASAAH